MLAKMALDSFRLTGGSCLDDLHQGYEMLEV